ncbi:DUF3611 family protein [Synechocystis sp. LKSZ1]|uniref:DUF3611 family protein n=1 Tax=Synechocystis sp. LKSZ1 TaxID=3144951 RepID=UPI00336BDBCC
MTRNPRRSDLNADLAPAVPQAVLRASTNLTTVGNIGFWVQIVVGAFAVVTFLFASMGLTFGQDRTTGIEAGIISAFISLILLCVGIYFSVRYRQLGRQLQNADNHPRRADILQLIRWGLLINLAGMGMAIIGAAAISGIVLVKSLSIPQGTLAANPKQFVQSIDLLAIQANTNTIIAHFTGLLSSLWLLDRIHK